jgi:sulfur-oxidizing protein SoxY
MIDRRDALAALAGAAALAVWPGRSALAAATRAEIEAFAAGATPAPGRIALELPEHAEDGASVPLAVRVDSPMTEADHVVAVLILADGNLEHRVAAFAFTPLSGVAAARTRIRLARSQEVIALARTRDGAVFVDRRAVRVSVGGCVG